MGSAKRLMFELEHQRHAAESICIDVGMLEPCEYCGDDELISMGWGEIDEEDLAPVRELVAALPDDDWRLRAFEGDRQRLIEAVKEAPHEWTDECGYCAHRFHSDHT